MNNTNIQENNKGYIVVKLYETEIVKFNRFHIILNSGGFRTATTKRRMNEISSRFNLKFFVYQHKKEWYIDSQETKKIPFYDKIKIFTKGEKLASLPVNTEKVNRLKYGKL